MLTCPQKSGSHSRHKWGQIFKNTWNSGDFSSFNLFFWIQKNPNISRSKLEKSREFQVFLKIWPHSCLLILVDISEARFSKILGILAIFQVSICFFEYKKIRTFQDRNSKNPENSKYFWKFDLTHVYYGSRCFGGTKIN